MQTIHTVFTKFVTKDLKKTTDGIKNIGKESDLTTKSIKGIGLAATSFAAVATAAVAATAVLANMGNQAVTVADEIGKTAKALNVTAEELQELRIIANDSGVAFTEVEDALKTFTERLGEFKRGTGEAVEFMDRLNISTQNVDGTYKSSTELFYETGRALANMSDEAMQADAANKLLGGSGFKMIEVFRQSEAEIAATISTAREYGAVLSNEVVASAEEYRSELDLIMQGTAAMQTQRALVLAPLTVEWENMKNNIASATISLLQFTGFLDIPVKDARIRIAELRAEIRKTQDQIDDAPDNSSIRGGGASGRAKLVILQKQLDEAAVIVAEAEKKAAEAKKKVDDAEKAREVANQAERERREKEHQDKIEEAKKAAAAAAAARKAQSDADAAVRQAKADADELEATQTQSLKTAKENQIAAINEIRQLQISVMEDDIERARAQTAFDIEQYEERNEAALTHISTQMEAEEAFAQFKIAKAEELAQIEQDLNVKTAEKYWKIQEETNKKDLEFQETKEKAIGSITQSLADSALDSRDAFNDMVDSMIKDLAALALQAVVLQAFGITPTSSNTSGIFSSFLPTKPNNRGGVVSSKGVHDNGVDTFAEQGAEAILPLQRDSNGNLGVKTTGGGSESTPVSNNVNITVNVGSGADADEISRQTAKEVSNVMAGIANEQIRQAGKAGKSPLRIT